MTRHYSVWVPVKYEKIYDGDDSYWVWTPTEPARYKYDRYCSNGLRRTWELPRGVTSGAFELTTRPDDDGLFTTLSPTHDYRRTRINQIEYGTYWFMSPEMETRGGAWFLGTLTHGITKAAIELTELVRGDTGVDLMLDEFWVCFWYDPPKPRSARRVRRKA